MNCFFTNIAFENCIYSECTKKTKTDIKYEEKQELFKQAMTAAITPITPKCFMSGYCMYSLYHHHTLLLRRSFDKAIALDGWGSCPKYESSKTLTCLTPLQPKTN